MADSNTMHDDGHVINVSLTERSYSIHIGTHNSPRLPELVARQLPRVRHIVFISDAKVRPIAERIATDLAQSDYRLSQLEVPSGEMSKSIGELTKLWQFMLDAHTDRGSIVVALGGGVVGDLAGFAAASFARGIPLVQIPTTLLSQVDSSVGGKTGINLPGAKNIVGAFWQPSLVLIDTEHLQSLPRREFVSGIAEVAKYGVIMHPELFAYLEQSAQQVLEQNPTAIEHIVAQSCECKAQVVAEDERETTGRRAILNYGHTFAHAIESVSGYGTLLHGEAVSIGMHMAAVLAHKLGRIPADLVTRQETLLRRLELPTRFSSAEPDALWAAMQHDKKVEYGKLRFVLPSRLGHVELVPDVGKDVVCETLLQSR